MFFTILIISVALGAEPERQFRIRHLVPAADRTLMLCHSLRLPHGLPLKFPAPLHLPRTVSVKPFINIEENQEIQHRHNDCQTIGVHPCSQILNQIHRQQDGVQHGKHLRLDREHKIDQKLLFREQHTEGKKHGLVQIVHTAVISALPRRHKQDQLRQDRQDDAADKIQVKPESSPHIFQRMPEQIIDMDLDHKKEYIDPRSEKTARQSLRRQNKRKQPPDLPVHDLLKIQRQKTVVQPRHKKADDRRRHITYDKVIDQVRYRIPAEPFFHIFHKFLHFAFLFFLYIYSYNTVTVSIFSASPHTAKIKASGQ